MEDTDLEPQADKSLQDEESYATENSDTESLISGSRDPVSTGMRVMGSARSAGLRAIIAGAIIGLTYLVCEILILIWYFQAASQYANASCTKPIADFCRVFAFMSLFFIVFSLIITSLTVICTLQAKTAGATIAMSGYGVMSIYSLVMLGYWIYGNVIIWSAKDCDSGLLHQTRFILIFTYCLQGVYLLTFCCLGVLGAIIARR